MKRGLHEKMYHFETNSFCYVRKSKIRITDSYGICTSASLILFTYTQQVDAFTHNWAGVNNWLVPSIYLVVRTIRYLEFSRAEGTLIIPSWESSQFWPFFFFKGVFLLQLYSRYFRVSASGQNILFNTGF